MPSAVTVLIPTLNEALRIGATIDSAFAAGAAEVIVCDGGSLDDTREIARSRGARVLEGETMRARQLNAGASAAAHQVLIFLHADTTLPIGACGLASDAVSHGARFGGFRLRFAERSLRLRFVAFLINVRTRITRCPWGDQAQFVSRSEFLAAGGFREIAIMEDYELALRMKPGVVLRVYVTTSGRRFLKRGVIRTTLTNWRIIFAWHRGVDASELARIYRGK